MNLNEAVAAIKTCCDQMNERYGSVLFDEWGLVSFAEKTGRVLAYSGPRKEGFQKNFSNDVDELRAELLTKTHEPGDFEFTRFGTGELLDAFTVVGEEIYLLWNNTVSSMSGISKDSRWLKAQVPFAELADKFRSNPVIV